MARSASTLLMIALAVALGGCGMLKKKQTDAAPSASQAVLQPPPPAASPTAPPPNPEPVLAVADEAIATPEDFEDEAFTKISDKTYKVELEALKKEIEAK